VESKLAPTKGGRRRFEVSATVVTSTGVDWLLAHKSNYYGNRERQLKSSDIAELMHV
jgi:hypothetical protein